MTNPDCPIGTVTAIWRYPVKSMQGEALDSAVLAERGLLGDRAYAVRDQVTGHIASAKHPRRWGALLACRAAYLAPPRPGEPPPPVQITLPDGVVCRSDQADIDAILSRLLGRAVALITQAPAEPMREAERTPIEHPPAEPIIRQEPLALAAPAGTFFDYAPIHLLTTATLDALRHQHPAGRFEVRRFRPNLAVTPAGAAAGAVEQDWLGHTLTIGAAAQLELIDPCPRCVVPTLAQGDLPQDPVILRVLHAHTAGTSRTLAPGVVFTAVAGVYGRVARGGGVRLGDAVGAA